MAHLPNGNGNGADLVGRYELEATHTALKQTPDALAEAAGRLAALRGSLIETKAHLGEAKDRLSQSTTEATMAAYTAGVLSGKNQSERDVQLADYLTKDKAVQTAKEGLRLWETQQAGIEARMEIVESDYRVAMARLSAARADAALQTAYLQLQAASAEPEPEAEYQAQF
jgi:capsule polysaccharide export protein KpsE/RkpR